MQGDFSDLISETASTAADSQKPDTTFIKDSNKLVQIDIKCLDKIFPIQIELQKQLAPNYVDSFLTAIEGYKESSGFFGFVTEYKLTLRFDEAHGPLLMAF